MNAKNIFLSPFIFLSLFSTDCSSEVASEEQFHWVQAEEELALIDLEDFRPVSVTVEGEYLGNRLLGKKEDKTDGENSLDFILYLPPKPIIIQIYQPVLPNINLENVFQSFYCYWKAYYLRDFSLYLSILDEPNRERRKDDDAKREEIENYKRSAKESANHLFICHGVLQNEKIYIILFSTYEKRKGNFHELVTTFTMAVTKSNENYYIAETLPDEGISMMQVFVLLNKKFPPEIAKHISVPPKIISEGGEQEVVQLPEKGD